MNSSSCRYDCANPPDRLTSNADISGIGVSVADHVLSICLLTIEQVSLAYNVTAGLSVCIVLVYYFLMFRPDVHVLSIQQRHATAHHPEHQTNPVDQRLLCWRLKSDGEAPPSDEASSSDGKDKGPWPRSRDALERVTCLWSPTSLVRHVLTPAVYAVNERSPDDKWISCYYLRFFPATVRYLRIPLEEGCAASLVLQRHSSLLSDILTRSLPRA